MKWRHLHIFQRQRFIGNVSDIPDRSKLKFVQFSKTGGIYCINCIYSPGCGSITPPERVIFQTYSSVIVYKYFIPLSTLRLMASDGIPKFHSQRIKEWIIF